MTIIECPECGYGWGEEDYEKEKRDNYFGCSRCFDRHRTMALTEKKLRYAHVDETRKTLERRFR